MADEPRGECPFPKPFAEDFRACPVYESRLIFPTDVSNRPLSPTWTCTHLQVASRTRGGRYASCGLGDSAGRARWLEDCVERPPPVPARAGGQPEPGL